MALFDFLFKRKKDEPQPAAEDRPSEKRSGTSSCPAWLSSRRAVFAARGAVLAKAASKRVPEAASRMPKSAAAAQPSGVSGESLHPCKRPSVLNTVLPWRTSQSSKVIASS